jgi:hypothetical protein
MENVYLLSILSGFVFGAFLGRFITKLKLALVYESRLKKRAQMRANTLKVKGGG